MEIIRISSEEELEDFAAKIITERAESESESISIALPWGRSVVPVLRAIGKLDTNTLANLRFYLIDERIDSDRNSDMIRKEAFASLVSLGKIREEQIRFPSFSGDVQADRFAYENLLGTLDLVFAGSGEDGHFASLFPGNRINASANSVEYIDASPKPPRRRLTLTFRAFEEYGRSAVYVALFLGEGKRDAYESFLESDDINRVPMAYLKRFSRLFVVTDLDEKEK